MLSMKKKRKNEIRCPSGYASAHESSISRVGRFENIGMTSLFGRVVQRCYPKFKKQRRFPDDGTVTTRVNRFCSTRR
jgi:hypothetical protein